MIPPEVKKKISSMDPVTRQAGARDLREYPYPASFRILKKLLSDNHGDVVHEASRSLIHIGNKEAAETLIPLLRSQDVKLRNLAVDLIARIGAPAIGLVTELLQDRDKDVRKFGVDILKVQEINRMVEITKVPQAPHYVEGVINLRGKVIPIIDLRKRFNLEMKEYDKNTRIVVVDINNNIMGMIVDAVSEVLRLPADTVEPPPELVTGVNSEYIKAVAKLEDRLLIFLDLSKVIDVDEMAAIG